MKNKIETVQLTEDTFIEAPNDFVNKYGEGFAGLFLSITSALKGKEVNNKYCKANTHGNSKQQRK